MTAQRKVVSEDRIKWTKELCTIKPGTWY